jgi:nicotinate phosphoribosyltransferase
MIITSLLDTDFYKFTMGQFAWKYYSDIKVKYAFINRSEIKLTEHIHINKIMDELDAVRNLKFSMDELNYLNSLDIFSKEYLNFLSNLKLSPVYVSKVGENLKIETEGKWSEAIFWETFILSIVNELYHASFQNVGYIGWCDHNTHCKINKINEKPFKFVEFGTRRRFSKEIQKRVLIDFKEDLANSSLIGTSNVSLAKEYKLNPIGTMAHELPMVLAGIHSESTHTLRKSHNKMLELWYLLYGENLSIALTDTFGSDFFFKDFTKEQAKKWKGFRQDSGNPIEFLYKVLAFYKKQGVNPKEKIIVFSDGLTIDKIYEIEKEAKGKIQTAYGWGTNLTNDVGYDKDCSYIGKPISIVVKAIEAKEVPLVKLSDNTTKALGNTKMIEKYKKAFGYTSTYEEPLYY